jgi:hypothetical protein
MIATLCGFDLAGFSQFVDRCIAEGGASATERIMDRLGGIFQTAHDWLQIEGFNVVAVTGDGLVAAGPKGVTAVAGLEAALSRVYPDISLRTGEAEGSWRRIELCRGLALVTGDGIEALHRAIRRAQPTIASPHVVENEYRAPAIDADKLQHADIAPRTILFLRIDPAHWASIALVAETVDACAGQTGGQLEAATHDDKGLMLRIMFPAASEAAASSCARVVAAAMRRRGIAICVGIASGPVWRGQTWQATAGCGEQWTTHGSAVNLAAKRAATGKVPRSVNRPIAASSRFLVGREEVCNRLLGAASAASPGDWLLVSGAAGLGKSAVLRWCADRPPDRMPRALVAAKPQLRLDPLACAQFAARGRSRHVGAARNLLESSAAERLPERLRRLARVLAEPLERWLLLLDDVQWIDAESLRLFQQLARRGTGPIVVATYRTGLGGAPPAIPIRQEFPLEPLGTVAIDAIIRHHRQPGGDAVDPALAGGSPLAAVQLALSASGRPEDLEDAIDRRVAGLQPDERTLLRIAAIAGRPFPVANLARLTASAGVAISPSAAGELVRQGFLHPSDAGRTDVLEPVHALISARVLETMPKSVRAGLHQSFARHLAQQSSAATAPGRGEIAQHWRAAGLAKRAAACFAADGLAALDDGAYSSARLLLINALNSVPENSRVPEWRALMTASHGMTQWANGNVAAAAADAGAAAEMLARAPRLRAKGRLAEIRTAVLAAETGLFTGNSRMIMRGLRTLLRSGSTSAEAGRAHAAARARLTAFLGLTLGMLRVPGGARTVYWLARGNASNGPAAFVLASEAVLHCGFGRWRQALECLSRADLAQPIPPDPHLAEAILTLRALAAMMRGDQAAAADGFRQLLDAALERGNQLHEAWGRYGQAMPLVERGDGAAALPLITTAQARLQGLGDRQSELICAGLITQAFWQTGDWAAALDAAEQCSAIAAQVPPLNWGSLEGYAGGVWVAAKLLSSRNISPSLQGRANKVAFAGLPSFLAYARRFPVGWPRLHQVHALLHAANERPAAARGSVRRAEAAAARLSMQGEWHRARHLYAALQGERECRLT